MSLSLDDMEKSKRKIEAENSDLLQELNNLQISANMLHTANKSLKNALDEQNQICTDEGRERMTLLSKFRNAEHDFEGLRYQMDDEITSNEVVRRQTEKAHEELVDWKRKYEVLGCLG